MWDWWPVVLQVPGKSEDRGRKTHGPGTERRRTGDRNVGLVVCGIAGPEKSEDRRRKTHGPGTGMWGRWPVVPRVPGKSEDRGREAHGPGTENPRTGDGNVGLVVCGVAGPGEK